MPGHRRLKQGVERWNKWREEHPGVQPDLREADLSIDQVDEIMNESTQSILFRTLFSSRDELLIERLRGVEDSR